MIPNTFSLNQFTITNAAGFLDNPINWNTVTKRIDPASTNTFYPGTAVKITPTGTIEKATPSDLIFGFLYYNEVFNIHTATVNFMVAVALDTSQMTLLAGEAIEAGDLLEFSPQTTGQDKVIKSAGTNTIIGQAMEAAATGEPLLVKIKINK